jgi:hypothetical protein
LALRKAGGFEIWAKVVMGGHLWDSKCGRNLKDPD